MNVQEHRKQRLRELMSLYCNGKIKVLADRLERAESYVSRMLYPVDKAGSKPIADRMSMVIETAFDLERAWLDKPLGYGIPGAQQGGAHAAEPDIGAAVMAERMTWPFKMVTYQRILDLKRALGQKTAQEAINDMDKQLDIVAIKWEREAMAVKSRNAA